jgi:hypothetical protein
VTHTLAWKDLREQQGLAAAVVGLGVACIAVITSGLVDARLLRDLNFWEPTTPADVARNMALAFAWTGGLIAGAIALAGEREAGTLPFLDALTRLRRPVWRAKCAFGAASSVIQACLLFASAWAYGAVWKETPDVWAFGIVFVAATLYSFAWGMFGSAYARTVLGACGLAIVGQVAGGVAVALVYGLLHMLLGAQGGVDLGLQALSFLLVLVLPLKASAARFCRKDNDRRRRPARPVSVSVPTAAQPTPWRAVLWLTYRQAAGWVVIALALAVVARLILPHDWAVLWPLVTGLLGLVAGVGTFAGEQGSGSARFLGDRRLPAGPLWRTKVGTWFGLAAIPPAVILLFALAEAFLFGPRGASLTHDPGAQVRLVSEILFGGLFSVGDANAAGPVALASVALAYVSIWLLYGFAIGQFAALVFRKAIIAIVVSLVVTGTALGHWLPSLAAGGLHPWQWLGPPVILLAATRLAVRPWLSDRLGGSRALAWLTVAALAAVAWQAGGLWYRPVEVVGPAEPFDLRSYLAGFPTLEQNEGGRRLTQAAMRYREREQAWQGEGAFGGGAGEAAPAEGAAAGAAAAPGFPDGPAGAPAPPGPVDEPVGPTRPPPWERLRGVLNQGWPADDDELWRWLDKEFAPDSPWFKELRAALGHPPGGLYDVRILDVSTLVPALQDCRGMADLLCVRALQLKTRDDAAGALDSIRLTLALARHLRSKSFLIQFTVALAIEDLALRTLERWAEGLGQNPELLGRALQMLREHEANAAPLAEALKGEYLVLCISIQHPGLAAQLGNEVPQQSLNGWDARFRMAAREAASRTLWEMERTERLLAALVGGYLRAAELPYARLVEQLSLVPESVTPRVMSREDRLLDGWIAPTPELNTPAARSRLADQLAATWWAGRFVTPHSGILAADFRARTHLRAAQLQMALALYEQREGKPARDLDVLVPDLLPSVPTDPYGGGPFHYRASEGEKPGAVWSVGPDLIDQGGRFPINNSASLGKTGPAGDFIYPVPRTKKPPPPRSLQLRPSPPRRGRRRPAAC